MVSYINNELLRHSDQVLLKCPGSQAVVCDYQPWLTHFKQKKEVASRIDDIRSNFPKEITRNNVIDYLTQSKPDLMTAFLMTMLWGHESDNVGKRDPRGPWKVGKMTTDYACLENTLHSTKESISEGDIINAYKNFKIPRCGPNFFTKFFYFVGKSLKQEKYPLIFDDRVATGLVKVSLCHIKLLELVTIQTNRTARAYSEYVEMVHDCSAQIKCDADQIELFLFEHGRSTA